MEILSLIITCVISSMVQSETFTTMDPFALRGATPNANNTNTFVGNYAHASRQIQMLLNKATS